MFYSSFFLYYILFPEQGGICARLRRLVYCGGFHALCICSVVSSKRKDAFGPPQPSSEPFHFRAPILLHMTVRLVISSVLEGVSVTTCSAAYPVGTQKQQIHVQGLVARYIHICSQHNVLNFPSRCRWNFNPK